MSARTVRSNKRQIGPTYTDTIEMFWTFCVFDHDRHIDHLLADGRQMGPSNINTIENFWALVRNLERRPHGVRNDRPEIAATRENERRLLAIRDDDRQAGVLPNLRPVYNNEGRLPASKTNQQDQVLNRERSGMPVTGLGQ